MIAQHPAEQIVVCFIEMASTTFGEPLVLLFVARAAFGEPLTAFFVASAAFGQARRTEFEAPGARTCRKTFNRNVGIQHFACFP